MDAPGGASVTTVPSPTPNEAPPSPPSEPSPTAPAEDKRLARVHGTVSTADGVPCEAEVQIGAEQARDAIASIRTARDGTYSLDVPAGDWSVCACTPNAVAWPESVTLAAGEEYELDLSLERGATVWGWVMGPNAAPLPGASVLSADQSGLVLGRGKSDASGQYRLGVLAEWCTVTGESDGLAAAVEAVEPEAGKEVRLDLRLGEPRRLSGRVVDEEERPVPGAAIELSRELADGQLGVHPSWRTEADAQGAFHLDRLPEGVYALSATAPSFLPQWIEGISPGGEDVLLVLARGARVEGQVVRKSDGKPVESPQVQAVGLEGRAIAEVKVGAEGRFALTAMRPGTYIVAASAKGFAPGESAPFVVGAAGVVEGIRVELSTGGTLRGVVLEESSRAPVAQAFVTTVGHFYRKRGSWPPLDTTRSASCDADGRFELPLLVPGKTTFQVTCEGFVQLRREVEILDGTATDVTFLMTAGGTVVGLLRAGAHGPALVTGGRICLRGERTTIETSSDKNGQVTLERLTPGKYRLFAFHDSPGRLAVGYQELEVRSGETARFEIVPGGVGRLSGHVIPPSEVGITLCRRGEDSMVEIVVEADASGGYEVLGAPPGEYDVRVSGMAETITLPEGAYDVRRDFELPLDPGR